MNIIWPTEKTVVLNAKDPTKENGIAISALPGGNPNKKKQKGSKGDEGIEI